MHAVQPGAKTVADLVAEAAPSVRHAQPWRFRFLAAERTLLMFADPDRAMPRSDPGDRAPHIGCGAALFSLRRRRARRSHPPRSTCCRTLPNPCGSQPSGWTKQTPPPRPRAAWHVCTQPVVGGTPAGTRSRSPEGHTGRVARGGGPGAGAASPAAAQRPTGARPPSRRTDTWRCRAHRAMPPPTGCGPARR
ncbi:hypothetical protein [Streptomyces sp. NPDC093060]|uniref:hypothetical protein n=1 Tax=Streptomyces sp. NPDC093060 TaxID=3366019 RepID=UPI00382B3CA2